MLDATELAAMRAVGLDSLPDTCSILRSTTSSDGRGGTEDVWAAVYTAVPCRMAPIASTQSGAIEDNIAGRIAGENVWTLTLGWDQDIATSDRVLYDGRTFEISYIGADRSWQIVKRVGLVELS